jgi:hypothetical protein
MPKAIGFALLAAILTACSSPSSSPAAAGRPAGQAVPAKASSNPVAKYIELVGFRLTEKGAGKIRIRFGVVNHSDADLGSLELVVNVRPTIAKPDEAPLFSFPVKVSSVGPEELKEVEAEAPTKLRIYELPDWQFLRADFVVTSPQ